MAIVTTAPLEVAPGKPVRGFDTAEPVTEQMAKAFFAHGYRFCIRYVRRQAFHDYDLDAAETERLLETGFALMAVQHVEREDPSPSWLANAAKGAQNGRVAAEAVRLAKLPDGVTIWCDLENAESNPAVDVIAYCNAWHQEVSEAGYHPGLYVGAECGLTPRQLFYALKFDAYWGALNLNTDEVPLVRGLQMKQHVKREGDLPPGFASLPFQTDTIRTDGKGGRPKWVQPDGWPAPL
jgi:hypothetical protein